LSRFFGPCLPPFLCAFFHLAAFEILTEAFCFFCFFSDFYLSSHDPGRFSSSNRPPPLCRDIPPIDLIHKKREGRFRFLFSALSRLCDPYDRSSRFCASPLRLPTSGRLSKLVDPPATNARSSGTQLQPQPALPSFPFFFTPPLNLPMLQTPPHCYERIILVLSGTLPLRLCLSMLISRMAVDDGFSPVPPPPIPPPPAFSLKETRFPILSRFFCP